MALNLSGQQRAWLNELLEKAEPYDTGAPEMLTLDGECDYDRWAAFMAKRYLEQDDKEKQNNTD